MSKPNRKRYPAAFKAKVALEALRGEETISALASKFGVHANLISQWKQKASEGLVDVFSQKSDKAEVDHEVRINDLHAKIGQLTVERDFLAKAFGR